MYREKAEVREAAQALEKDFELSNITDLRRDLLPIVDRLQTKPAERYLILKHGRPQAVLMSFQTYNLVKKAMNLIGSESSKRRAVDEALAHLRSERSLAQAKSAEADREEGLEETFAGAVAAAPVDEAALAQPAPIGEAVHAKPRARKLRTQEAASE
jgi:PHD/YefM family antitoxin component YafN of YafNO toxin-antitoxin module